MKRSQVVFGITTLLLATNINFATAATTSLTAKQTTTVKAYFAAIAHTYTSLGYKVIYTAFALFIAWIPILYSRIFNFSLIQRH